MTALGVVFRPQLPPERLREMALAADRAGLDELWLWEDCFLESGIATASAALAWTERLRVGVGLLPAPLRNVALTSMEAATLHRLFPGRVLLGVGHGVQDWMAQVGARVDSPVTLLREYLEAMRALLAGERVTSRGRYVELDQVALDWPPLTPPPVLAGAIGPRSLRLTGESADGTVVDARVAPEGLRKACALVEEGRRTAGRTAAPHPVTVYVHAATGPGAAARVAAEIRREGHDPSAGLGAVGSAAEIAEAVLALADAGADTVVLQPTADEPDPEGFVRFAGEQVRPLVSG
ncbi:LLM class flavin-dependent oxidoreductase [Streptomyces triticagri]|uniref:LLM class flavin-dependent oxidoreductase n=1 Tax=Streptomyces triticagri TaxID=2293568 RepID=A0A372LUC0_9ACTN|nr:LLM class flavin-dependent oxidoreductase [Streptomyces triticagri]RFU82264.1 LLM class flavin-dependent oxidoreductase [Streptomyces triticagri]